MTLLELFYTWQLIQVEHIKKRPILLLGNDKMWDELVDWIKKWPMSSGLLSEADLSCLKLCTTVEDVTSFLEPEIKKFYEQKNTLTNDTI